MSKLIQMLLKEMDQEAATTRKMLKIVPVDQFDWKPHPKSMSLKSLATHVAELPSWVTLVLNTDELDFAAEPYNQVPVNSIDDLFAYYEKNFKEGREQLAKTNEAEFEKIWTLRNGDAIYWQGNKYEMIRGSFCQTVHHRAQLGVFLRLLNIPIPGSYGPSADETF